EEVENALKLGGGKYGRVNFDARYRYEYVDQERVLSTGRATAIKHPADASTLRIRLGYLTPSFAGFTGFAEYEGNQDIGFNDYNSTRNGRTAYPIVADPQANEVNQLWVNYAGLPDSNVKVGRQRIVFDNHRFIGNVGWRQMEQTFDAATVTNKSLPDTTITAGYIWKVQDITSRSIGMNSPIFNIAYTGLPYGKIVAHGEWLDYDTADELRNLGTANSFTKSTKTVGLRFDGSTPVTDDIKALYTAEYAHQSDYKNNPIHYHADYWLAEGGLDLYGVTVKAAYEELGSDNGAAFQTPLATLHAFQGWADKFLTTPASGIRDMYGTVKTTQLGIEWTAMYHEFSDASSKVDLGHEIDLMAEKKFGKHYSVMVKYADYVADPNKSAVNAYSDTQKIWLQGSISF
ncbi:alginate export family protein, partial [Methylogaea oryzae]